MYCRYSLIIPSSFMLLTPSLTVFSLKEWSCNEFWNITDVERWFPWILCKLSVCSFGVLLFNIVISFNLMPCSFSYYAIIIHFLSLFLFLSSLLSCFPFYPSFHLSSLNPLPLSLDYSVFSFPFTIIPFSPFLCASPFVTLLSNYFFLAFLFFSVWSSFHLPLSTFTLPFLGHILYLSLLFSLSLYFFFWLSVSSFTILSLLDR